MAKIRPLRVVGPLFAAAAGIPGSDSLKAPVTRAKASVTERSGLTRATVARADRFLVRYIGRFSSAIPTLNLLIRSDEGLVGGEHASRRSPLKGSIAPAADLHARQATD